MIPATTSIPRSTLAAHCELSGTGLHSGVPCRVLINPSEEGGGIHFQRAGRPAVRADWMTANAEASDRRTVIIGESGERFEQIEHLVAALAACGVTDAEVIQEGPEVPFLGGGSREYMEAIRGAGVRALEDAFVEPLVITEPVSYSDGNVHFAATPHDGLRMSVFVEFPGTVVGSAGFSIELTEDSFFEEVSRARTFVLARDIEQLRSVGLIRGGNLGNAVVFDAERYHNESLHFADEVVRHKVIDLWGDLALLARPLRGHFWAWRAGHRSHVRFAQYLAREIFKLR
jgi:UDP-3-O-[3-hydroxymyristoyl] N-acetylglucosamine deacetylase